MAGQPRSLGGVAALLIALAVGLVLALSQRTTGPSRAELAQALSRAGEGAVAAGDLRSLKCGDAEARGYACRWQQREDDLWRDRSGRLGMAPDGWRMIGERP